MSAKSKAEAEAKSKAEAEAKFLLLKPESKIRLKIKSGAKYKSVLLKIEEANKPHVFKKLSKSSQALLKGKSLSEMVLESA